MAEIRSIFDLSTEEAYRVISREGKVDLPSQDVIDNEDWGRDYVLECFLSWDAATLKRHGLTLEPPKIDDLTEEN